MGLRRLLREIRRLVLFLGLYRRIRLHLEERGGRLFVLAISKLPENAADRVRVVAKRKGAGHNSGGAALTVRIVERGRTHAHDYIRLAPLYIAGNRNASADTNDHGGIDISRRVADVVRSWIRLCERSSGALQFALHGCEKDVRLRCG